MSQSRYWTCWTLLSSFCHSLQETHSCWSFTAGDTLTPCQLEQRLCMPLLFPCPCHCPCPPSIAGLSLDYYLQVVSYSQVEPMHSLIQLMNSQAPHRELQRRSWNTLGRTHGCSGGSLGNPNVLCILAQLPGLVTEASGLQYLGICIRSPRYSDHYSSSSSRHHGLPLIACRLCPCCMQQRSWACILSSRQD